MPWTRPADYPGSGVIKRTDTLRRIVFTLNNYTAEEHEAIKHIECTWMIIGQEVGDEGTPHLQGAIVFGKQYRFAAVKRLPGLARAHIERMAGQPCHSADYCSKQDPHPYHKGIMPNPGKRNDIHRAVQRIQAGETLQDLAGDEDGGVAVVKYYKGLSVLRSMQAPIRREPPLILWLHGPTGVGKTKAAYDFGESLGDPGRIWISHGSLQWFDGYDGQQLAILDDLRTKHCAFHFLLRLLDRYPMSVPFKGGYVNWNPKYIIITAPYSPTEMWSLRTPEDKQQLIRRCSHILSYTADEQPDLSQYIPITAEPASSSQPDTTKQPSVDESSLLLGGDGPHSGSQALPIELSSSSSSKEDSPEYSILSMYNKYNDRECATTESYSSLSSDSGEDYVLPKPTYSRQNAFPQLQKIAKRQKLLGPSLVSVSSSPEEEIELDLNKPINK